jgi:hypothetical protein
MSALSTTELLAQINASSLIRAKGQIRPLVEDDFSQITSLWRRVGGRPVPSSASFMKRLLFELPWRDGSLSSLAYEDASGQLIGCLGIMPRPMMFQGRAIRAAVGHHLIVEPSTRGTRAGIELARRFLRGPQDLSLAAGNEFGRRIWTFLGGSVTPLHSFSWTRALRPARYALEFLRDRGLPASAAATLHPACQAVDATLNLVAQRAFPLKAPSALSDDLDAVTMLACLSAFASDRALQPCYDVASLAWLLETLGKSPHRGHLHKVAVRTQSGRPLGWYLYYLGASGSAEVLQVGGKEDTVREVLHHLFYHARQRGAVAVTGPMDARLLAALSENDCMFHGPGKSWTLIHSRNPRIADAIHAGDAFLSRLEGALWAEPESWRYR